MKVKKYRAAIVGAGQMGAGTQSGFISHAAAFTQHLNFELSGIYDPCKDALLRAMKRWKTSGFTCLEELMHTLAPEIISICSPDEYHTEQLEQILKYSPQAIIVEKPVSFNQNDAQHLTTFLNTNVLVIANYSRRYIPTYYQLKKELVLQKIRAVNIRYAKGILHNGAHAIDLIRLLFGEVKSFTVLAIQQDYVANDPTVSVQLRTTACENIILQGLNHNDYTHFEVDIYTHCKRYTIHSDHRLLDIYTIKDQEGIPPGKRLKFSQQKKIAHENALNYLLDNVVKVLHKEEQPIFPLQEALKTEKIAHIICHTALLQLNTLTNDQAITTT